MFKVSCIFILSNECILYLQSCLHSFCILFWCKAFIKGFFFCVSFFDLFFCLQTGYLFLRLSLLRLTNKRVLWIFSPSSHTDDFGLLVLHLLCFSDIIPSCSITGGSISIVWIIWSSVISSFALSFSPLFWSDDMSLPYF